VLVVEADDARRTEISDLLTGEDVKVFAVATGDAALEALAGNTYDAAVLDVDLPDRKGFDLVDEMRERADSRELPILFYSQRDLTKKEETHLKRLTQTMPLRDVRSPQRLLDDVALFLHLPVERLPAPKRAMLDQLHQAGAVLAGKKGLVVDDDIRNIFAMTSILEPQKMEIFSAETGKAGAGDASGES
jgi:CheY-like chemotaxis protein